MRPRPAILVLAVIVGAAVAVVRCASAPAPPAAPAAAAQAWTVVRVVDGDTLVARNTAGAQERVRLRAIDTPERGEPGFDEAAAALEGLLARGQVSLVFEGPGEPPRDRYGRVLAYTLADGVNTSVEMVRLGWSAYATQYGPSRFDAGLRAAEAEARAARRGLWATR